MGVASSCCLNCRNLVWSIPVAASIVDHRTSRFRSPSMNCTSPSNSPVPAAFPVAVPNGLLFFD